jgi:fatty acid desaturase
MIVGNASKRAPSLTETQQIARDTGTLLSRKIWIPKLIYAALPFFYICAGIAALLATLYIGHWLWVLPHYLFFAAACLHMGFMIYRRRSKSRDDTD